MTSARYILLLASLWLGTLAAYADDPPAAAKGESRPPETFTRPAPPHDSLRKAQTERNDRLYDSLRVRSERKRWTNTLYKALFRSHRDTTRQQRVLDEDAALAPYVGRRIGSIRIERMQPFDPDGSWLERTANTMHTLTRERIIRRDLLFEEGDLLDPHIITRNKQLLQSRRYISDVSVDLLIDSLDTTRVDLVVRTRDSWTIDVDAGIHSGGESSFGLSESNLLGRGHMIRLETNLNYRNFDYGGNVIEYGVPNLWGSFYGFNFAAGRSFNTSCFDLSIEKEFLRPTDYELGASFENDKRKHYFLERDATELIRERNLNLWTGYAHQFEPIDASLYLAVRYNHRRYGMRPADTSPTMHPLLHDQDLVLVGAGLFREHFYSANMIYGYGQREYIATGFKGELLGGYRWGEFGDDLYFGCSFALGGFTRIGYLMGCAAAGGFLSTSPQDLYRGTTELTVRWFSNLYVRGRSRLRHFVSLGYTYGWDRLAGADETIRFTEAHGLHALDERVVGTNRLVLNTESVLFTPYQPWGFKLALFGFVDGGMIGFHDNIFRNDPFVAFGVGARIRNERLVFKAIQLRLGIAFGPGGLAESRYFRFSSASALQQYRYRPSRPEILTYK